MEANWIGYKFEEADTNRYNKSMIVKKLRELFKQEFPKKDNWKFSIAKMDYNGIRIRILKAPEKAFDPVSLRRKRLTGNHLDINDFTSEVATKLEKEGNAFNYDNSDGMHDYFDRNYYLNWECGNYWKTGKELEII